MANYNVELNRWNGSSYDQLLPKNTLTGSTEPTTATVGVVGQFYINTATSPKEVWQCLDDSGGVYTWEEMYSPNEILSGATKGLYGLGSEAVPNDVLAWIGQYAAGAPKIETGSYTGTGTYGSTNPNSLTFDFTAKLVIVGDLGWNSTMWSSSFIWKFGDTSINARSYSGASSVVTFSQNGNTLQWYATADAVAQINTSNKIYRYVAIG